MYVICNVKDQYGNTISVWFFVETNDEGHTEVVDPEDIDTLSDLLVAGVNEAIKKVTAINNEEMSKVTGSLSVPGMGGLL